MRCEATNLPGIFQCIFQGEGGDWHVEAQNVASIYFNAVVTIAAVDGSKLSVASSLKPGLYDEETLRSLLWSVGTADKGTMTASAGTIKGPSWSWVSICKPIRYNLPLPTHHGMGPPLTVNTQKTAEALLAKAKILELSVKRRNEFSFDEFDGSLVIEGASLKGFIFDRRIFVRKTSADTSQHIKDVREYKKRSTGQPWKDVLRYDEGTRHDERLFHDTESLQMPVTTTSPIHRR
ncbi:hypothetical protein INS49_011905 [Diaporthe citri]|uniref:uncharacterized protein n=1 Tax=Diaporthe citri TaxID=83186 RepID=UPI001C7F2E0D|nr:uncharacterized protein INS49_011905 [Diaporthe citri]KAG6360838.1 hypothetical protein INS49_011905 [Diaporthe citri]